MASSRRLRRVVLATVRARVAAAATVAVIAVLLVSGFVLVALQRETLTSSLDDTLARNADVVETAVSGDALPPSLDPRGDEDMVAQLVAADGHVLAASENLRSARRVSEVAPPARGDRVQSMSLFPGEGQYRLLARSVRLHDAGVATLYVGNPLDDVRENVATLTRSMLGAIPVMAAILASLVWWLVGRTLRPVEEIRARVAAMSGTDTDKRVPEPPGDDEVARLARTMNAMLARIDDASNRQQRFVADASHELRTPLTRMRTEIEVDLAHPAAADIAATQRSVLDELDTLQRLVEDLLLLARADAGATAAHWQSVNLAPIVLEEKQRAEIDGATVDTSAVGEARVSGDARQLRRVVRNLLDNAVRHARAVVTIGLVNGASDVSLWVADDGPGVPVEDRERIFERFTRVDAARSSATGGAGLGLAIAREIVSRHGGTISLSDSDSHGARFEVTLPNEDR